MICSEISAGASWVATVDSLRVYDQLKQSSRCFCRFRVIVKALFIQDLSTFLYLNLCDFLFCGNKRTSVLFLTIIVNVDSSR